MKEIPLNNGMKTKVSDHRFLYLSGFSWYAKLDKSTGKYYAFRNDYSGKIKTTILMHREIMQTPKGLECDHKNRDSLDNQDENLRNCTASENQINQGIRKSNTSGYKGVSKKGNFWKSKLNKNGVSVFVGYFKTAEEAAKAYDIAAVEHYGEFAFTNFD